MRNRKTGRRQAGIGTLPELLDQLENALPLSSGDTAVLPADWCDVTRRLGQLCTALSKKTARRARVPARRSRGPVCESLPLFS
ncbi:MAG TPA: hypothetical protein VEI25_13615 [Paraburkholderia sp.]|nr:hypothetical protein [Paraburkholderia sp.]